MPTTQRRITDERVLADRLSARRTILDEVEYAIEHETLFDVARAREAVKHLVSTEVSSDRPDPARVIRFGYMLEAIDEIEQMISEGQI
jgi:hypothetical protein